MRALGFGVVLAAGIGCLAVPALATPSTIDVAKPEVGLVTSVQLSRHCRRLQRACEFKNERGQAGEGNCRRFRNECGMGYRRWDRR
jgi:hypothetical protein